MYRRKHITMIGYLSYALISSALTLGGWILSGNNKSIGRLMGGLFYISLIAYVVMTVMQDWSTMAKVLTVSRDVIMLSGFSALIMAARKIKILPYIILATFAWNLPLLSNYFKANTPFKLKLIESVLPTIKENVSDGPSLDDNLGLSKDGELLIELKSHEALGKLDHLVTSYDLDLERAFHPKDESSTNLDEYYVINIPDGKLDQIEEIKKELKRIYEVLYLEPNEMMLLDVEPGNPPTEKHKCNHVDDPLDADQWMHEELEMDKYYGLLNTLTSEIKKESKLFILDSGVDSDHEDLVENYTSLNTDYDVDGNGHGTHCAGIAAAVTNNGKGIASFSISKEFVEVTGIKVMSSFGFGTQKMIIDGIIEAADNGADVISMSLGGISNQARQKAYNAAMKYANDKGAIVIVAAGNSSMDAAKYSPANSKGVIAVAATDENSLKASFTNTVENIEFGISAPGVNIMSALPNNEYKALSGTSMATPHVAGLVAVMKSLNPKLTHREVFDLLNNTGEEIEDHHQIGKMIQPYKVVKALVGEDI